MHDVASTVPYSRGNTGEKNGKNHDFMFLFCALFMDEKNGKNHDMFLFCALFMERERSSRRNNSLQLLYPVAW